MYTYQEYRIIQSGSTEEISSCAKMMAGSDPWVRLGMSETNCLQAFEGDYRELYLLKKGTEIAGFIILQIKGSFKGYIQTLFVAEKFRGEKLGSYLLEFAENQIHQYSPNVFICVSAFNESAIRLYTRFGFSLIGVLKDFVKEGYDELLMRKTIGPMLGYQGSKK